MNIMQNLFAFMAIVFVIEIASAVAMRHKTQSTEVACVVSQAGLQNWHRVTCPLPGSPGVTFSYIRSYQRPDGKVNCRHIKWRQVSLTGLIDHLGENFVCPK